MNVIDDKPAICIISQLQPTFEQISLVQVLAPIVINFINQSFRHFFIYEVAYQLF